MVRALQAASPDLTNDSFVVAMESLEYDEIIAGTKLKLGADDHIVSDVTVISQICNGSWEVLDQIE